MKAMAFDTFGMENMLDLRELPKPTLGDDQVLLAVQYAGIGTWDTLEKAGLFAEMYPGTPQFPYVLGSEGSGTIAQLGTAVKNFHVGEQVFGIATARSPKLGLFAEYTVLDKHNVWPVPKGLSMEQAAALAIDGGTALRGLRDVLKIRPGETVMIVGASGGVGHLAVQLAKSMGARVYAVASGDDGAQLASELGADDTVDGRNIPASLQLPKIDAVLLTAYNDSIAHIVDMVKGARIAYPYGVQVDAALAAQAKGYSAEYDDDLMGGLIHVAAKGELKVLIEQVSPLEYANEALASLRAHHLGRTVLKI